jgi:hypothetical protein
VGQWTSHPPLVQEDPGSNPARVLGFIGKHSSAVVYKITKYIFFKKKLPEINYPPTGDKSPNPVTLSSGEDTFLAKSVFKIMQRQLCN